MSETAQKMDGDPIEARTGVPLSRWTEMFVHAASAIYVAGIDHSGCPQISPDNAMASAALLIGEVISDNGRKFLEDCVLDPISHRRHYGSTLEEVSATIKHRADEDRAADIQALAAALFNNEGSEKNG